MDANDIREIFIRGLVLFVIMIGLGAWNLEVGIYTLVIKRLFFIGAVAVVVGPMATEGGFWVRGHYVDKGTPGCAWYALGVSLWIFALIFLLSSCRGR